MTQEGFIGLYHAVKAYDGGKDIPFDSFAKLCIKRQILTAYRRLRKDDDNVLYCEDMPAESDVLTEQDIVSGKSEISQIFMELRKSLSNMEIKVLDKYLKDLSYGQIASDLNLTAKQVDNALLRIKRKIKEKYGS